MHLSASLKLFGPGFEPSNTESTEVKLRLHGKKSFYSNLPRRGNSWDVTMILLKDNTALISIEPSQLDWRYAIPGDDSNRKNSFCRPSKLPMIVIFAPVSETSSSLH